MPRRHQPAEEGDGVMLLQEDRTEPVRGRIALHHERLGEVGEREHQRCCDRSLERGEGGRGLLGPGESFLAEQGGEGSGDGTVVLDELAVIPGEAEEAADYTRRLGLRLVRHGLHLGRIHRHAPCRDRVPQVRDGSGAERALGMLDEVPMLPQDVEDGAHMP